jgi:hypothetical protein
MEASVNLHVRISKRSGQPVQAVKGRSMQLQNWAGTKFERPFCILYVRANDVERQRKLSKSVFSFPTRDLVWIA